MLIRGPQRTPLLHSVLHDDIHVGWACGASGCRGLHADRNSRAGCIVLRNRAEIVGRRSKRYVHRSSAICYTHHGVGRAACRSSFGLGLNARNGDGFVQRPGRSRPGRRQRAGQKNILFSAGRGRQSFTVDRHQSGIHSMAVDSGNESRIGRGSRGPTSKTECVDKSCRARWNGSSAAAGHLC